MNGFDLSQHGIGVSDVRRNTPVAHLYEDGILYDGGRISSSGSLVAFSGEKTGRSPKDKHIVREPGTEGDVWWGPVNFPIEPEGFEANLQRARDFLNAQAHLYAFDGFAGWDPAHRIKVRIICSRGSQTSQSSSTTSSTTRASSRRRTSRARASI